MMEENVEEGEKVEEPRHVKAQNEKKTDSKIPAALVLAVLLGAIAGALAGLAILALFPEESEEYTETDPVYGVSAASGITGGNITNWDTA